MDEIKITPEGIILTDPFDYFTVWFLMQIKVDGKTLLEYQLLEEIK